MKVFLFGGKPYNYEHRDRIRRALDNIHGEKNRIDEIVTLVERTAQVFGSEWARHNSVPVQELHEPAVPGNDTDTLRGVVVNRMLKQADAEHDLFLLLPPEDSWMQMIHHFGKKEGLQVLPIEL